MPKIVWILFGFVLFSAFVGSFLAHFPEHFVDVFWGAAFSHLLGSLGPKCVPKAFKTEPKWRPKRAQRHLVEGA